MNRGNFFAELKRRNVYKVGAAYVVVAWLLIQVATQVFPFFQIPDWAVRLVVLLLALGFPVALVLAWAFELTPEGIKKSEDVPRAASIAPHTGRKLWVFTAVAAVAAATLFALGFFFRGGTAPAPPAGPDAVEKSIAVLPFENLSDDKSNAYFADGIQDQILTKLASVGDLKVISRTSTVRYKNKPEDLKTVAQQLGVATVLEGTVQRAGDRVRVNVQLIDARTDAHLWAKNYDRELKDVFDVQSEIAEQIADALQAKLSPIEATTLSLAPTRDPEAYDLFLKGEYESNEGERTLSVEPFERATAYYRKALARDPGFALAAARLARCRLTLHWYARPLTARELDEVKAIIDSAVKLAPNLPETHIALGLFDYWGYRRYDAALRHFRRTIELQPNSADGIALSGYVYRRKGEWERSLAMLHQAEQLSPRDPGLPGDTSVTYANLRQWADARRMASRALALEPHWTTAMRGLLLSHINGDGDIAAARRAVSTLPAGERLGSNARGTVAIIIDERTYLHVLERNFAAALADWQTDPPDAAERARALSARAAIYLLAGDGENARKEGEEALPLLEGQLRERPDDPFPMTQLSWSYLAVGRAEDALRSARRAVDALPITTDAHAGPTFVTGLAEIQVRAGEPREAIEALRQQLAIPAGMSVSLNRLKIDPVWDPIRNDPEFQQLLAGKEQVGPNK
jgi:TolB-like protein/cytochrome c-type biogenesis protein CcmH/NrfG